jgi:phage baseplate assembly protein W
MNPTFGGGLRDYIFEQIAEDTLDFLKQDVEQKLEKYFPSVIINSLDVLRNDDDNSVIVQLKYSVANSNINDNITFQF